MNWLHYLAEANIYLGVFYMAYCLFLAKETYYQLNRAYLILSCVAAFMLPLMQVGFLKPVEVTAPVAYYQVPVQTTQVFTTQSNAPQVIEHYTLQDYAWFGYLAGAAVLFLVLLVKLFTLYKLTRNKQSTYYGEHKVICLPGTDVAFSFFNYLFLGTHAAGTSTIIRHELVHIRQKHSLDIIFLELIKIISWFNPCIYLLQNSLKSVHEYIADEQTAIHETDALTYSSFLVNNAYGAGGSSITHSFFNYNLLKKRIIMLNQQRSGNLARLKYLVAIPVCAGLLCASTLAFSKTYAWVDLAPAKESANTAAPSLPVSAAPTDDIKTTSKGYKYEETGFLIKGKENYRVIIYEKDGSEKGYSRNVATPAELKLLKDKYGYSFPTMKIYTMPLPPPPSFAEDGYDGLEHHIFKTIAYHPADNERGDFVDVGFTVTSNHLLDNIKIEKSGGSKFDKQALNAFNTYKLPIPAKTGNYKVTLLFFNGQETSSAYAKVGRNPDPSYVGVWALSNYNYQVKRTSKGYEYDEYAENLGTGNKLTYTTVIYEKNGDSKRFGSSPISTATITLLKDKYGYAFPKGSVPPPPTKAQTDQIKTTLQETGKKPPIINNDNLEEFKKYMAKNIRYPAAARDKSIAGKVMAVFTINADHKIQSIKILRSPANSLSDEVIRVLQKAPIPTDLDPKSFWTIPFNFVVMKNDSAVKNDPANMGDAKAIGTSSLPASAPAFSLDEVVIVSYMN